MLFPVPSTAPTGPYAYGKMTSNVTTTGPTGPTDEMVAAVAADIIDRLPASARLISDMHPLSSDPENSGEPTECEVCQDITCPSWMSALVDSENMPDAGGPTYVEACDDCVGRVCGKLADAGIGVDEAYDDDED